jgi:hypothetical protein
LTLTRPQQGQGEVWPVAQTTGHALPREVGMIYEITVRGELSEAWREWFDAVRLSPDGTGDTVMTVQVADQAALFGALRAVRDCGLDLVAVRATEAAARLKPDLPDQAA